MPRLRELFESLDHSQVWALNSFLIVATFVAFIVSYDQIVGPDRAGRTLATNEVAIGCYSAADLPNIVLDKSGLAIPDQNIAPIEFKVRKGRGGKHSYLELSEPLAMTVVDGQVRFSRGTKQGVWRAKLTTVLGGTYSPELNNEPVANLAFGSVQGRQVRYKRGDLSTC